MAIAEQQPRLPELHRGQTHEAPSAVNELADKWGRLTTIATLAVLPIWPLAYVLFAARYPDQSFFVKGAVATGAMVITRGALDVLFHRWIPWPNLYGAEVSAYQDRDARARRRSWFWTSRLRFLRAFLLSPLVWLPASRSSAASSTCGSSGPRGCSTRSAACSASRPASSLKDALVVAVLEPRRRASRWSSSCCSCSSSTS